MDNNNRKEEEAMKHKTLAESKYKQSNLKSALKHAMKAHNLSQTLDGVSELITSFTILLAAVVSGEDSPAPDYYKILQLEPFAHINSVKKQYRKLALILHPDKNSFEASEEAFKVVGEAFRCLSDKVSRKEYDTRMRIAIQNAVEVIETDEKEKETFCTACSKCRLLHQFEKRYLGHKLMCQSCKTSFLAVEVETNEHTSGSADDSSCSGEELTILNLKRKVNSVDEKLRKRKMCSIDEILEKSEKMEKNEEEMTLAEMQMKVRKKTTLAEMQLEIKRKMLEGKKVGLMEEEKKEKVRRGNDPNSSRNSVIGTRSAAKKSRGLEAESPRIDDVMKKNKNSVVENRGVLKKSKNIVTEMSELSNKSKDIVTETHEVPMKSKDLVTETHEVSKKSKDLVMYTRRASKKSKEDLVIGTCEKPDKSKGLVIETNGVSKKSKELGMDARGAASKKSKTVETEIPRVSRKSGSSRTENRALQKSGDFEIMTVEDSDFYDFDRDRVERSFKQGQVWAIYDDDDGMPRHYGLIEEVISNKPFELKMCWLDLQNNNADQRIICWEKLGFRISCGKFKASRKTVISSVNFYSHVVDCDRVARELYMIYPKKGSVWALYREESVDKRCYDIVVFLTSYSEQHGLSMAYLEKVDSFKTVFKRREVGPHAVKWFEKDDIRLFSHQIPARKLSGEEAPASLGDCWELDPASLPKDLLTITLE